MRDSLPLCGEAQTEQSAKLEACADWAAIIPDTSPRCIECSTLEIDHQFMKVSRPLPLLVEQRH